MNKIVNRFLLAEHEFIPEMCLRLDLSIVLFNHLLQAKQEYRNLKKQEMQGIFIKTKFIKLAFSMS